MFWRNRKDWWKQKYESLHRELELLWRLTPKHAVFPAVDAVKSTPTFCPRVEMSWSMLINPTRNRDIANANKTSPVSSEALIPMPAYFGYRNFILAEGYQMALHFNTRSNKLHKIFWYLLWGYDFFTLLSRVNIIWNWNLRHACDLPTTQWCPTLRDFFDRFQAGLQYKLRNTSGFIYATKARQEGFAGTILVCWQSALHLTHWTDDNRFICMMIPYSG